MPSERAEAVTGFLREEAGEDLRGVVSYDADGYDILHIREDVRETRLKSEVDEMVVHLEPETEASEEAAFPFADFQASVRVFGEAVVLHLPQGDGQGTVVALETGSLGDVDTLLEGVLEQG